jgi:hypothetical protein
MPPIPGKLLTLTPPLLSSLVQRHPSPTTPVDPNESSVDNVRIRRTTSIDDIRALFSPGSAIRSDDLNKNFEQLRYAIQEANCQGVTDTVYQYLLDNYWDRFDNTLYDGDTWVSDDTKIATTEAIDDRVDSKIDAAIEDDILIDSTGLTKSATGGQVTLGIGANSVDFDRIKNSDIINTAEQDASSVSPADTNVFTASAAARRFDTLVQTGTPSGSAWETGKTWYQNDDDKTVYVWDGDSWEAITSGGAFTRLDQVIYVDATNGDDANNGHRISTPKQTIKSALAAINSDATYGDGSTILVAPGVYRETAPLDIQKKDVSIIGASIRNTIIHPTEATETNSLFRVNSGSYLSNMTFTGVKASGTRGDTGSLWEDATYGLPPTQGWNVSFYPDAMIYKSPYIQNCTNFSDSEIDNDALNFYAGTEDKGRAGDLDSAPTGGGLLVNGDTVHDDSPLRSMVADSYTHVGLDGPGVFVTNNGYSQITSSYSFFNHFHIACINGGQANLAASTTDFGRYSLIASGRSTSAIFTATVNGAASSGSATFDIDNLSAGSNWHGSATRPQDNMLVDIGGNTYPVLSATAITGGWRVEISRPDTGDRTINLGLNGNVADNASVSFYLRSMVASSGHTMEYVGSGTDYTALPENGGVPNDNNQVIELSNGKVWAAITDHNGTFKVGDTFEVNQQTGFVNIPAGALSVSKLLANLDTNNKTIVNNLGDVTIDDQLDMNSHKIVNVTDPTSAQDAATKAYVDALESDLEGGQLDNLYFRQDTGETIESGDTWSSSDASIATTAAIDARIIDLVDDVGGFVPIVNETSFPASNPDVNDGTGTLISIKEIATSRTPSSGTVTIANGSGSNTVTITGCGTTVLAAGYGAIVETTSTLHTYTFHRLTPLATEVSTLASNISDINTVADNIADINTVEDNIANINTVANDLNEATSEIDTVATNITNVNNVGNNIADVETVADNISNVNSVGSDITNVNTVAGSISNVNTVATNIASVNNFSNVYRIDSSNPTTSLDVGDLVFNTTDNELRVYNGSTWQAGVTATAGLVSKSGDTMTGNLLLDNDASAAAPDLGFDGDDDTGIYSPGANQFAIATGGTGRLFVDASGNVGVGTTSPAYPLVVASNITSTLQILSGGSTNQSRLFFADANDIGIGRILYDHNDNSMQLYANNTERLRITSAGLVGIGTSSPTERLHVDGNVNLEIAAANAATRTIELRSNYGGGTFFDNAALALIQDNAGSSGGSLQLRTTTSGGSSPTTALTIDSSQRVGIGTTSPYSLLDLGSSLTGQKLSIYADATYRIGLGALPNEFRQYTHQGGFISWGHVSTSDQSTFTERARIDSSGR